MQTLARFGIVVLMTMTLVCVSSVAKANEPNFEEIGQQLQRYDRDLRDVGKAMRAHARSTMPEGLNQSQRSRLAAERRELVETADATLKLAIQIEGLERKAQRRTLTRADMESLGTKADPLAGRIKQRIARAPTRKSMSSTGLNEKRKKVESREESDLNKRQEFQTMFENFDQKANQLFKMLSTVMKNIKEMNSSVTRNML